MEVVLLNHEGTFSGMKNLQAVKKGLPEQIIFLRHGQSSGNVAAEAAEQAGHLRIDIALRDVDVPLSALGERQAHAVGRWLAELPRQQHPTVALSSPYIRAQQTANIVLKHLPGTRALIFDERLREREFGIVDRLTKKGIIEKYPEQAEFYLRLHKFYYRPPGGESWCDVILRLRSVMDSLFREFAGERVIIFCHTAVILCFRYLFEKLNEEEILKIDGETQLANCSLTSYRFDSHQPLFQPYILEKFNFTTPLTEEGEVITRQSDTAKGDSLT